MNDVENVISKLEKQRSAIDRAISALREITHGTDSEGPTNFQTGALPRRPLHPGDGNGMGHHPESAVLGLALSSDGRRLYASVPDMNEIMVIDTATHRTVRTFAVGGKPFLLFTVKAP